MTQAGEMPEGAVSMDDVTGWYGAELSKLNARLVQAELMLARERETSDGLRQQLRMVQGEQQRLTPDPGAFASAPTGAEPELGPSGDDAGSV